MSVVVVVVVVVVVDDDDDDRSMQLSMASRAEMLTPRYLRDRRTDIRQVLWCRAVQVFVMDI